MNQRVEADVTELLRTARSLYGDDAPDELGALETRCEEPLRLAIAGIVKAGKSTLLNAMLGERVAATDAGECTRLVTWYRYGTTSSVTLIPRNGAPRNLPIKRANGGLTFDLDIPADDVDRVEVRWPAPALKSVVLIDTPGIASLSPGISARTTGFLAPDDAPPTADAIIYLLRHLHPSDLGFLQAFRDRTPAAGRAVNAVAVLSRADEIGSGRIDSLLSARKVAGRYEQDETLNSLVLGVFPVAGLLAEGARAIRGQDFQALDTLAGLPRKDRERLLASADRFVRLPGPSTLGGEARKELTARFGMFGVRLATSLIRAGLSDAQALATELARQSGLEELVEFIELQLFGRAATLKAQGILENLERLLQSHPIADPTALHEQVERIRIRMHEVNELLLLSAARTKGLSLAQGAADAVRIVGGEGLSLNERLGLPIDADSQAARQRLSEELATWRSRSHDPANDRAAAQMCQIVLRTLEGLSEQINRGQTNRGQTDGEPINREGQTDGEPINREQISPGSELGARDGDDVAAPDVVLAGRPGDGSGEHAHQQRE